MVSTSTLNYIARVYILTPDFDGFKAHGCLIFTPGGEPGSGSEFLLLLRSLGQKAIESSDQGEHGAAKRILRAFAERSDSE
jgi:hypothetical protein